MASPEPLLLFALSAAERLQKGTLAIELPDGSQRRFAGGEPGPSAGIRFNRARAVRRFLTGGGLGFAEAYLDGDWDSPDLPALLQLLALNEVAYDQGYYGRGWYRWLNRARQFMQPNTRPGSKRNILAHYDLGNRFFERWLDPTMTYSSARFGPQEQSLERAQQHKYATIAAQLGLERGHQVLEIGCGWGGFAEFVATEIGARVVGITISDAQHDYARQRMQAAGLGDQVDIRLMDYRDLNETFDRVASIEMFEAVGERYWPTYFAKVRDCLVPGGLANLQIITIADRYFEEYRRSADFIRRYVFPGGMLPSPGVLERLSRQTGLEKVHETWFGQDYARTLATWGTRFRNAWPEIRPLGFDERFRRLWEYYLAYCQAGFQVGYTDVGQLTLKRV